jgi:hypothetical protein
MMEEQEGRLVAALEMIAQALAGIDETKRREFGRRWPEPKEKRDAVVTRIPTEEDRIRENHGASGGSLEEWLGGLENEPFIGDRERQYLEGQRSPAGSQAAQGEQPAGGGAAAAEGQA